MKNLDNSDEILKRYRSRMGIAVEAKVRTLLNAEIQSEITSDFLLTRSAILRLLYLTILSVTNFTTTTLYPPLFLEGGCQN